ARLADGCMGSGGSSKAEWARSIPLLKEALAQNGRDLGNFPISKRVFMSVHERADTARSELLRWFTEVYHNPPGTDLCGMHGMAELSVDPVKRQVAAHWNRRALGFDEGFGHSIATDAERAAWDRIIDLVLGVPKGERLPLDALDIGCGTGFLSLEMAGRGHRV